MEIALLSSALLGSPAFFHCPTIGYGAAIPPAAAFDAGRAPEIHFPAIGAATPIGH
jgi:hypothetical protein